MIVNVPQADELRKVSLRLYFKAWDELTSILIEWEEYGSIFDDFDNAGDAAKTELWAHYIGRAQSDLQGIYTLIQQSQEIGAKALICEVSPYLLLKRTDVRAADGVTWDFTDFPTIDAAELIRIQNVFCVTPLSRDFQTQYDEIRRNRNKIYHLGLYRERIDPHLIIDLLQTQYSELYPGRRWMADRLHFATLHRWAEYGVGEFNEKTGLFRELLHLLPWLSASQFRWLMQHDRETPRYVCHECAAEANLDDTDIDAGKVPTAYRVRDAHQVRCVICDRVSAMRPAKCPVEKCGSEFASSEALSEGLCMQCGWLPGAWEEHQRRQRDCPPTPTV